MSMKIFTTDTKRQYTLSLVDRSDIDVTEDFVEPERSRSCFTYHSPTGQWSCTQAEYAYWAEEISSHLGGRIE